jgi:hypothetical protein
MRRLVYSPKAFVYIQTDEGVYNISDLVTAGEVHRVVDDVSTASVTFQNPGFTFTQAGNPTFRPMDKITIFLQRIPSFPVQVFTGYLDDTPYYQMYPGTITLSASCTLKRLNYTYFDAGLPFMTTFFARYGWQSDGNGSLFTAANPDLPDNAAEAGQAQSAQSSSMSELMFAVLKHIAGWDEQEILIEELPEKLTDRISKIYEVLIDQEAKVEEAFTQWLKDFIGAGSSGGGGMAGGGGSLPDTAAVEEFNHLYPKVFIETPGAATLTEVQIRRIAEAAGFKPGNALQMAQIAHGESGFKPGVVQHDPGDGNVGWGLWQITPHAWGSSGPAIDKLASLGGIEQMLNPVKCAVMAKFLFDAAGGVRPWYGTAYLDKNLDVNSVQSVGAGNSSGTPATTQTANAHTTGNETEIRDNTGSTSTSSTSTTKSTRYDAIKAEANRMSGLTAPYNNARPPSDTAGYDCSSSVTQLLKAAGYKIPGWPATNTIKQYMHAGKDPSGRVTFWNSDVNNTAGNSVHIWAEIDGKAFTTADHRSGHYKDGYYALSNPTANGFTAWHVGGLDEPADIPADADTSGGGGSADTTSTGVGDAASAAKSAVVYTTLNFPQAVSSAESMLLTGEKSLMNDQPLLPFIQQLSKGTLRSFQSLPNGDFYAFHPDYFGAFGTSPYWEIDDIEVLEGNIQLSDKALVTHSYVIGATLGLQDVDQIANKIATTGVVTLLNAGTADFLNLEPDKAAQEAQAAKTDKNKDETALQPFLGDSDAVLAFLQRYGARPLVDPAPFIRSHIFETFYAFQNFMLAWSRQFLTTFSFTFMPELYPGGLCRFKDHDIQMYIDEVHHSWDYSSGFTTQANLSAPSSTGNQSGYISRGMVRAFNTKTPNA